MCVTSVTISLLNRQMGGTFFHDAHLAWPYAWYFEAARFSITIFTVKSPLYCDRR